ncbi:MAG: hypothetical protein GY696_16650 [Gammaproteobacteria bacterium]|nr:hypothetical protein [Gammaproteobacteria bacterium]
MLSFGEHRASKVTKNESQATRHFYCNRSYKSRAESNGEEKRKGRLSGKLETACTANIKTVQRLPSGEIVADVCLNHYGHELDRRHLQSLRLPTLEKEKLSGKIIAGVSLTRVLEDVVRACTDLSEDVLSDTEEKEDFGDLNPDKASFTAKLTALHMVTMRDLRNLASGVGAKGNKDGNDAISVGLVIHSIVMHDCEVPAYKPIL